MPRTRPFALLALLTLTLAACSQAPEDLTKPTLEPQLGSPDTDYAVGVAFNKSGHLYSLTQGSAYYEEAYYTSIGTQTITLHRHDRNGNLLWERNVRTVTCNYTYEDDCDQISALDVGVDGTGNSYALTYLEGDGCEGTIHYHYSTVTKTSPSGSMLWSVDAGSASRLFVDSGGNVYVIGNNNTQEGDCEGYIEDPDPPYAEIVTKYSPTGKLLWQRKLRVGTPQDVVVSSAGNVYVVGTTGMSRYNSSGTLNWTKSSGGENITISGSDLYLRKGTTIRKHDGVGNQLWSRSITGLSSPVVADITGDTLGNLYITGNASTSSTNRDAFFRKVSSSGSVVWTKVFGTAKYDDGRGIATYDGNEIYVGGGTQGILSEANRSGSGAYLRKMDKSGNRVWTR